MSLKFICPLIVVRDMKIARNFYEQVLGQKVKDDFGENLTFAGDFSIHQADHFQRLCGKNDAWIVRKANNFELYFETDEMEQILLKLENNQVEFLHKINEQPWGQRVMRCYDPDGHIVEVGETMEAVVIRFQQAGMTNEEISIRTSLPIEFVNALDLE